MKKLLSVTVFLLMAVCGFAAGFDGTWTTKMQGPDGGEGMEMKLVIKVDGEKVTASMSTQNGDMPFTNVVKKDNTLTMEMKFNDQTMKQVLTLKDENTATLKMIDSPMGDREMTFTKQK
jgi:hypothetical protein